MRLQLGDILSLCDKDLSDFTDQEKRLLIYNYIYTLKGIDKPEVMKAKINSSLTFATNCHKAYHYFNNLKINFGFWNK